MVATHTDQLGRLWVLSETGKGETAAKAAGLPPVVQAGRIWEFDVETLDRAPIVQLDLSKSPAFP